MRGWKNKRLPDRNIQTWLCSLKTGQVYKFQFEEWTFWILMTWTKWVDDNVEV